MSGARDAAALPSSPWIIRGEILEALRDGEAIRAAAAAEAVQLRRAAEADAARLREQARQEGRAAGEAAGAALLANAAAAIDTFRRDAEAELLPLAFAVAHRILGAFPEDERLLRAARTALDEHRGVSGLRLRAAPATAEALRAGLRQDGREGAVSVDADGEMEPGRCTLVHPRGRAAVGPLDQLRALFDATAPSPGAPAA
jgi:flagellar biosynthesis/type III secretory pathway protein FliH